jgi:hypothetical protein
MKFEEKINQLKNGYAEGGGISKFRNSIFGEIHEYYTLNGFPASLTKYELSLIPSVFQEANYDGINWTDRTENLGHLSTIFDLDCMFQNKGNTRVDLTDKEFDNYVKFSMKAIKLRTSK